MGATSSLPMLSDEFDPHPLPSNQLDTQSMSSEEFDTPHMPTGDLDPQPMPSNVPDLVPFPLIILILCCSYWMITMGIPFHLAHQQQLHAHLHLRHMPTMPSSTALTRNVPTMPSPSPLVSKTRLVPVPTQIMCTCTMPCLAMDTPTVLAHASHSIIN